MRTRRALHLALACVACAAACSGYSSTNGGDTPDAGGAPDASADGEAPAPPPGSSGDAGVDGPWCQLHEPDASICDDFDEPGTFAGKWTNTDKYNGTEDTVDDPNALSPPRVLMTTTDGDASDVSTALLDWHVASATSASYGFSLRVDHAAVPADGGSNEIAFFQLGVTSPSGTGYITLHPVTPGSALSHFANAPDGGTIYGASINGLPAIDDGKWHTVVVNFSLTPPRAITVSVDGATPKDDELQGGFDPGALDWAAGITFALKGNDGWKVAFDNVWLESH